MWHIDVRDRRAACKKIVTYVRSGFRNIFRFLIRLPQAEFGCLETRKCQLESSNDPDGTIYSYNQILLVHLGKGRTDKEIRFQMYKLFHMQSHYWPENRKRYLYLYSHNILKFKRQEIKIIIVYHQFFVDVKMNPNMKCDLLLWQTKIWCCVSSWFFTRSTACGSIQIYQTMPKRINYNDNEKFFSEDKMWQRNFAKWHKTRGIINMVRKCTTKWYNVTKWSTVNSYENRLLVQFILVYLYLIYNLIYHIIWFESKLFK